MNAIEISKPRIVTKRPVAYKAPRRPFEKAIFKIIVEMAYEADRADKIKKEINAVDGKVEELFEMLIDERKTKNLRSFTPTKPTDGFRRRDGRMYIPSIKCQGIEYPLIGVIEYQRSKQFHVYHERGVFKLNVQNVGAKRLAHKTFITESYDTAEQYINVKQELKEIFIGVIKYHLWK